MRPLLLKGHERSITKIKYNLEGDLLFSSSKDKTPSVWYSANGERLGTYDGHNGVIWCLDVSWDSRRLLTGSGDNDAIFWDVETGGLLHRLKSRSAIRTCGFSYSANIFFLTTDATYNQDCTVLFYDCRDREQMVKNKPYQKIDVNDQVSKITAAVWGPLGEILITGHENGDLCHYDPKTGDRNTLVSEHVGKINDLQTTSDCLLLISASKDSTSKLFNPYSLDCLKTYKTERPVNSACISPLKEHILLGGGQEAIDVTTTSNQAGKFEARFYHLIFEEEFARVKGHFGPINTLAFHPDGKSYASGGEDGYVRIHYFDDDYLNYEFEQ